MRSIISILERWNEFPIMTSTSPNDQHGEASGGDWNPWKGQTDQYALVAQV